MLSCNIMLCSLPNTQGYILPRHSSTIRETPFRIAIGAALKAYQASANYGTLLSNSTGAVEIQTSLKSDICTWVSVKREVIVGLWRLT